MEAIGRLAGGIAHDFNNLLTAIRGNAELMSHRVKNDPPMAAEVDEILHAADRAASLTRQLLAFSRKQVMQPVKIDLNEIINGVARMVRRLIGAEVQLKLQLATSVSNVLADPAQIEQVLLNLIVNARDAMPNGGMITVRTANVQLDAEAPEITQANIAPGDFVMLAVADNGIGMDQATQARIFEPFFTTKETGRGTGLGLSTVYGIIRQTGGAITVTSERGKGASFRVYLPAVHGRDAVIRKPVVLITGAGGEIGHGLIDHLAKEGRQPVITLDVNPLEPALARKVQREFSGSIMDKSLLERVLSEFEVETVYHLAALLSTRSEFTPVTAHQVNVEGTLNLLEFSQHEAESHGRPVTFLYPSSIAAYGLPDLETKRRAGKVKEDEFNTPSTMYGANKLYCEQLGRYYAKFYKQLAAEPQSGRVDFRSVRFPGLISALTVPSGGTSDYAPEMIHAAAKGEPYACFVRPDTRIPFMAMPDGVEALLALARAPKNTLSRTAYNLSAFNPSAEEVRDEVLRAFPKADLTWHTDREAAGYRRFMAGGRGRHGSAARLGLRAELRFHTRVSRLPDPNDRIEIWQIDGWQSRCCWRVSPR